ncbi:hypothetical protein D3C71_1930930 [compost metagenome]
MRIFDANGRQTATIPNGLSVDEFSDGLVSFDSRTRNARYAPKSRHSIPRRTPQRRHVAA